MYHHQEDVIGFCGDMRHPYGCLDDEPCPTCGRMNADEASVYCSNAWHLTGEDRIPELRPYVP